MVQEDELIEEEAHGADSGPPPELTPQDVDHARHGPDVKRRSAVAGALGVVMTAVGAALEPEKHERTQIEAEAAVDDEDANDELLKRISFGAKDPLW